MKKNIALLFFLFVSVLTHSFAQIAGYMGKRAVIGYSNYFMFAPKGAGPFIANPKGEASPTINNVNCLNFDYVYNQKRVVCLSGQFMLSGLAYDNGKRTALGNIFNTEDETPYPPGHKYIGDYSKPARLRSINFSFGVKTFRRGFVPPVGGYRKMEVLLLFEKVKYDYKNFAVQDPLDYSYPYNYIQSDYGIGEYSFFNMAFAYSFGYQRVLNEKFVLDYGIRFAVTPQFNIIALAGSDDYVKNPESYYKHEANMRMLRQQLINFHLGIGFLAF